MDCQEMSAMPAWSNKVPDDHLPLRMTVIFKRRGIRLVIGRRQLKMNLS